MSEELEDQTLYVRGLTTSAEEIEDVWDDTILNNAYDKALRMANEQVAKRIAMETNSKKKGNSKVKPKTRAKEGGSPAPKSTSSKKVLEWKPGMPCRAIYEYDGQEYEAFLVKMIDDKDCMVKFLGYDNSERVPISSLQPTLGNEERMRQVEAALGERDDDGFESQPGSESVEGPSDAASPEPAVRSNGKKKKANKKKKNANTGFEFGDLPRLPMPTMNMFRHMGVADMPMPMPPPPLATLSDRTDAEEQAISDMLLSWYMTGYYTGLYQQKRAERKNRSYSQGNNYYN